MIHRRFIRRLLYVISHGCDITWILNYVNLAKINHNEDKFYDLSKNLYKSIASVKKLMAFEAVY